MLKIKEIMLKVRNHAISDDETRPQLNGVYFDESHPEEFMIVMPLKL